MVEKVTEGIWARAQDAGGIIRFWKDYISMCEKLGYNLSKKSVLFPKNVVNEHDKVSQLIRIKHDLVMDEAIKAVYPNLNGKYYYGDEDYLIRPPKDFDDFVQEGVKLLHCVCSSGYYKRHVEGTRLIFLIRKRKKPSEPFYTMEYDVDRQKIVQCQGYRHAGATSKVKAFTGKWLSRHAGLQNEKVAV